MFLTKQKLNEIDKYLNIDFTSLVKNYGHPVKSVNDYEVMIADVHSPYQDRKALNQIKEHSNRRLTIIGDWFDNYYFSRFTKKENKYGSFENEFAQAVTDLFDLCQHFSQVRLMLSNHDMRIKKHIFETAPKDLIGLMNRNILEDILKEIPNLKIINHTLPTGRTVEYLNVYKGILLTHIEKSATDPAKAVIEISKMLDKHKKIYGIKDYDAIIQAHNHCSANFSYGAYRLYQIPCLIDITQPAFDYVFSGKVYGNPTAKGYMKVFFDNNKIDTSKTQIIEL